MIKVEHLVQYLFHNPSICLLPMPAFPNQYQLCSSYPMHKLAPQMIMFGYISINRSGKRDYICKILPLIPCESVVIKWWHLRNFWVTTPYFRWLGDAVDISLFQLIWSFLIFHSERFLFFLKWWQSDAAFLSIVIFKDLIWNLWLNCILTSLSRCTINVAYENNLCYKKFPVLM